MTYVQKPTQRNGQWCVVIRESISPLAKKIEVISCGGREAAYQSYRRIKKQQGKGL